MNTAIEVRELSKRYEKTEALRGLTFHVPAGSLCGMIGLNGAGKTTTLRILMGMARPDSGAALIAGLDCATASEAIRARTALVPETKTLFPYMTVHDVVAFTRAFYPKWRPERERTLREAFDLDYAKKLNKLSKGTLAKVHLLLALSRGADVIILDEPTDGLDAIATDVSLRQMAALAADEGVTILFASHRMEEIEQLADHLVVIDRGRCLLDLPADELRAATKRFVAVLPESVPAAELTSLGRLERDGRSVSLTVWHDPAGAEAKLREFGATSVESDSVPLRRLFVDMVGGRNAVA